MELFKHPRLFWFFFVGGKTIPFGLFQTTLLFGLLDREAMWKPADVMDPPHATVGH